MKDFKSLLLASVAALVAGLLLASGVFAQELGNMTIVKGSAATNYTIPITPSSFSFYSYQVVAPTYKAYFRNNSNTAEGVRFEKDGYYMTYDISGSTMMWAAKEGQPAASDTLGSGESSNSQNTQISVSGSRASYPMAFSNTTVTYDITNSMMKENYVLYGLPSIKSYLYLEYTGHLYFNKTLDICANGRCYRPTGSQDDFNTTGKIEFRNQATNQTVFWLEAPIIIDSNGNSVAGYYMVRGSNAQMVFSLRIPTSFLQTAKYPIYFDPTVSVPVNISQNESKIEYFGSWFDMNYTLYKHTGNQFVVESNIFVFWNENRWKLGAEDNLNRNMSRYLYVINSTKEMSELTPYVWIIQNTTDGKLYETHNVDFEDVCAYNKTYSKWYRLNGSWGWNPVEFEPLCNFSLSADRKSLSLEFWSNKTIDPAVYSSPWIHIWSGASAGTRNEENCSTLLADVPTRVKACVSSFASECISVHANINVTKGGEGNHTNFSIANCEIRFNMTSSYSFGLVSWGNLSVYKANITTNYSSYPSVFKIMNGNFSISDSFISRMGGSDTVGYRGVEIYKLAFIKNTTFSRGWEVGFNSGANGSILDGVRIMNITNGIRIWQPMNNVTINNSYFTGCLYPVRTEASYYNSTFSNIETYSNSWALTLVSSHPKNLVVTNFTGHFNGDGINMAMVYGVTIDGVNISYSSGTGAIGIRMTSCQNSTIQNVTILGRPLLSQKGLLLSNAHHNTFTNFSINGTTYAVEMSSALSRNNTLDGFNVSSNIYGLLNQYGSNSTFRNLFSSGSSSAIAPVLRLDSTGSYSSDNNYFEKFSFINNRYHAILSLGTNNNFFRDFIIENNGLQPLVFNRDADTCLPNDAGLAACTDLTMIESCNFAGCLWDACEGDTWSCYDLDYMTCGVSYNCYAHGCEGNYDCGLALTELDCLNYPSSCIWDTDTCIDVTGFPNDCGFWNGFDTQCLEIEPLGCTYYACAGAGSNQCSDLNSYVYECDLVGCTSVAGCSGGDKTCSQIDINYCDSVEGYCFSGYDQNYFATLLNGTFSNYSLQSTSNTTLIRQWYLNVAAKYSSGTPQSNVNVSVWDTIGSMIGSALTGVTGFVANAFNVTEYSNNSITTTWYNNYTVYGNRTFYQNNSIQVNVTGNTESTIYQTESIRINWSDPQVGGSATFSSMQQNHVFVANFTDRFGIVMNATLEFNGANKTATNDSYQWTSSVNGLNVGSYTFRWWAANQEGIWNVSDTYTYIIYPTDGGNGYYYSPSSQNITFDDIISLNYESYFETGQNIPIKTSIAAKNKIGSGVIVKFRNTFSEPEPIQIEPPDLTIDFLETRNTFLTFENRGIGKNDYTVDVSAEYNNQTYHKQINMTVVVSQFYSLAGLLAMLYQNFVLVSFLSIIAFLIVFVTILKMKRGRNG